MHGIIRPISNEAPPSDAALRWAEVRARLRAWRNFMLVVLLPTALLAGYYYLIAADQYQSEAHYTVSEGGSSAVSPSGFGELVGLTVGSQSQSAVMSVAEFLRSHDAVEQIQSKINLVAMFRRPEADFVSKLYDPQPTPEALLKYYRGKVKVHYDRDTGLTELQVRTFRPEDSYRLARQLMDLGERRVNEMNKRSYADAVAAAQSQLDEAERAVAQIQGRVTGFRQAQRDINPQSSGEAQLRLVSELRASLAAARSQMNTMGRAISRSSPQYVALAGQVRSLEAELASQSGKLAGGSTAIASDLGNYEDLQIRQQFAAKRYEAAAAGFEKARSDAQRQQLYLVRVVEANRPVKSLFPQRERILLTVFISLLLAYSIGWLIAAGVREHAA